MSVPETQRGIAAIRERLGYQPVLLAVSALLAGAALTWAHGATKSPIAAAEASDLRATLTQVMPQGFADNDLLTDVVELDGARGPVRVHVARRAGTPVGAVFRIAERGYAGEVALLMAVDADGRVLGVRVLKHAETPGLGDKVDRAKSPWIDGFTGKSLAEPAPAQWAVKKDGGVFDAFAGATITPRAVVKAVRGGLEFFSAQRAQILGGRS
ncbi:electron transport complex subunit RsxG [Aromatoleum toluclasticum]|uniref:electron transport complex subunit RsxG n=1 Tax=Aromatoleum toluclasticum TaxID=92003 RepID=UPI000371C4EB|nr:electron transport complex subunit RsxG [Aromatoleum toluclasticum]